MGATTYTGSRVTAPQTRRLAQLDITKASVGPMDNNAYLLRCRRSNEALLIDAASEPATLLELVAEVELTAIVTTHRHADHWQALAEVAKRTGATTVAHPLDSPAIGATITQLCSDGDLLTFGEITLSVIHLQGHTPGSIALRYDDPTGPPHLWTGDSLFPGGLGNTFGSANDFASLLRDVTEKLFAPLPDDTWVYPGHGDDTALGAQRPSLPEWECRGW
ncbi:MAG: Zn-dependent hydrolase [Acidimicrobiales bacterium]|nr:MAG: Zn-dependent hydrolase [Acidimicrobiales bacterium]